ncbi:unnamed protein product, partial [Iphiclides podalirius]
MYRGHRRRACSNKNGGGRRKTADGRKDRAPRTLMRRMRLWTFRRYANRTAETIYAGPTGFRRLDMSPPFPDEFTHRRVHLDGVGNPAYVLWAGRGMFFVRVSEVYPVAANFSQTSMSPAAAQCIQIDSLNTD